MFTLANFRMATTVVATATWVATISVAAISSATGVERPNSASAEKNGLSLRIMPVKSEFAADDVLAFRAVWKNTSDKPFLLFDADYYNYLGPWKISAKNVDTGEYWWVWQGVVQQRAVTTESRQLDPGAEFALDMILKPPFAFSGRGQTGPLKHLPRGRYEMTFAVTFQENPFATERTNFAVGPHKLPHWTGQFVSAPVALTVLPPKDFSISVTPKKDDFAEGEPLAFRVAWENTSAKPFLLFDADFQAYRKKPDYDRPVISQVPSAVTALAYDIDTGETWYAIFVRNKDDTPAESRQLDAGAVHEFDVALPFSFRTDGKLKENLPPGRVEYTGHKLEKRLPSGRYKVVFAVDFKENRFATEEADCAVGPYELPHWTGKAVSAPVVLTVKPAAQNGTPAAG
jgi:hypothetical protein